ncbi:22898_t:CDS:2, partial [Dentiscutata erythropus]
KDVQLDDGGRMIEKFSITTSIRDIILHFEKASVGGGIQIFTNGLIQVFKPYETNSTCAPKKSIPVEKICKSRFYQQPYWIVSLLKSTTLQSAGITSGNTVLRLLFRQPELTLDE